MKKPSGLFLYVLVLCFIRSGTISAYEGTGPAPQSRTATLTVQEAVQMALDRSPEMMLAEAQAARAAEALREIRSLNRPQVSAGTGLAYNNGYPLSMEGAAPSIFQIAASHSIFSRKNSNLIREAEEAGKASRYGKESARNELAAKTALVYYELYKGRKAVESASAGLDAAEKQEQLVETLFEAGKVRPVDLTLARTNTSFAQQQLLVAREQATVAEAELRDLIGLEEPVSLNIIEPGIDSPLFELPADILYKQALGQTPEIHQAEANIRAKEFHLEAEKGERMPRMDIIGQYALFSKTNNYDDFFNRFTRNNFLVGLSLQVPLFNGSRTSARIAQSRQEVSEARHELQRVQSELKLNIQRGLSALRIARGASDLARRDLDSARELARISETLLETGRISTQELEDSRSQIRQKEQALIDADHSLFQRKLELLRITGSVVAAIQ